VIYSQFMASATALVWGLNGLLHLAIILRRSDHRDPQVETPRIEDQNVLNGILIWRENTILLFWNVIVTNVVVFYATLFDPVKCTAVKR
jgi:hypothetical protein